MRITLHVQQEINPDQIPHPSKAIFKFPPPWARCTVKCPGGKDVEASIWKVHNIYEGPEGVKMGAGICLF